MTASTSREVSSFSKSGFRAPGVPMSASTAVPPLAGFGTVAMGWHAPTSSSSAAPSTEILAAVPRVSGLLEMRRDPDVGHGRHEERHRDDPGRPVDLALEAAPRPVAAAQPLAAAADRPAQARGLGRLDEHSGHEQQGQDDLDDDERVLDVGHFRTAAILPTAT